ncbi:hypothetical protein GCM10009577_43250 [Streptomyces javensis]
MIRPAPVSQPTAPTTEGVSLHHSARTAAAPPQITRCARAGTGLGGRGADRDGRVLAGAGGVVLVMGVLSATCPVSVTGGALRTL